MALYETLNVAQRSAIINYTEEPHPTSVNSNLTFHPQINEKSQQIVQTVNTESFAALPVEQRL